MERYFAYVIEAVGKEICVLKEELKLEKYRCSKYEEQLKVAQQEINSLKQELSRLQGE